MATHEPEIYRIHYFATTQQDYLKQAHSWLAEAEYVCDLALNRATGEHKQLVSYLRFYIDLGKVRLAFDAGEGKHAARHIQAVHHRAMEFADAYSTGQVVATVSFLTALGHAEHQLQLGNFDDTHGHLIEAEDIFSTMEWHSIESQHRIACVRTKLALANNDREHPKHLQHYMTVFHRYPCFEYRHWLAALQRAYPKELANVTLPDDDSMFLDTTYTHIYPFVRHV